MKLWWQSIPHKVVRQYYTHCGCRLCTCSWTMQLTMHLHSFTDHMPRRIRKKDVSSFTLTPTVYEWCTVCCTLMVHQLVYNAPQYDLVHVDTTNIDNQKRDFNLDLHQYYIYTCASISYHTKQVHPRGRILSLRYTLWCCPLHYWFPII